MVRQLRFLFTEGIAMNVMKLELSFLLLLMGAPSLVYGAWSIGDPRADAELYRVQSISSGGMTDQPSTDYSVYLLHDGVKYDRAFDTSPAMGAMWDTTLTASYTDLHDCPVADDVVFVLESGGVVRAIQNVDMNLQP